MADKRAKIAIVGAGTVARDNQIPAFKKCENADVVVVFDRHIERAQALCDRYGIPKAYDKFEQVLADKEIDCVSICTGNVSHEGLVVEAANAGKNILCEKPMAISVQEAENMKKAVEDNGVTFMMAFVNRFRQESILLSESREAGRFGDIYHARCGWVRRRGTPSGWFTDHSKSGGGAVLDIGVHVIDLTWYLMGRPKPVLVTGVTHRQIGSYETRSVKGWAATGAKNGVFDNEEAATALIRFENGASMSVDISWAINGREEKMFSKIYGTKGGASFRPLELYGEENGFLTDTVPVLVPEDSWQPAFERETQHFVDCVLAGKTPMPSVDDGLTVQRMLNAIYDSDRLCTSIAL
ncbi:MAG: Gfo/Idh/MocA family protein [Oscillospiraceae bacterium]